MSGLATRGGCGAASDTGFRGGSTKRGLRANASGACTRRITFSSSSSCSMVIFSAFLSFCFFFGGGHGSPAAAAAAAFCSRSWRIDLTVEATTYFFVSIIASRAPVDCM